MIVIIAATSFLIGLGLLWSGSLHGEWTADNVIKIQNAHHHQVSRIGGLAIYLSLAISSATVHYFSTSEDVDLKSFMMAMTITDEMHEKINIMLLTVIPAFLIGLLEDVTKAVGRLTRLFSVGLSAYFLVLMSDFTINSVGVKTVDLVLQSSPLFATTLTIVAVASVVNFSNFIDGLNGLCSATTMGILAAFGFIALSLGDNEIFFLCCLLISLIIGFFILNWPSGSLFLGDGGAYLLGFCSAFMALYLHSRHPTLSAWAIVLTMSYPLIDSFVCIIRRLGNGTSPMQADLSHLHSLLYTASLRQFSGRWNQNYHNSLAGAFCAAFAVTPSILAVGFFSYPETLVFLFLGYVLVYLSLYSWLLRVVRSSKAPVSDRGDNSAESVWQDIGK